MFPWRYLGSTIKNLKGNLLDRNKISAKVMLEK